MASQLGSSALLILLCAVALRWYAGARVVSRPLWVLGLDLAPLLIGVVLFSTLTARPLLGALIVAALVGGLIAADMIKRQVLLEPVVFADRAELLEIVRHPEFYLPFAGTAMVLAGATAIVATAGLVAWVVPPLWHWSLWASLGLTCLVTALFVIPTWTPVLRFLKRSYEGLAPTRDPAKDTAQWGMLACFMIHATLARAERPSRRMAPAVLRSPLARRSGPVVLAQLESFFDVRRLHAAIPQNILHGFDTCCVEARTCGPLDVPTWGANTIRSEFAALTGLDAEALGLDRFNAYERFARTRLDALPWRMRALGFRTICLHPFDKRFYGRHRAIPALGFDEFIGLEAFPRIARGDFISDGALAEKAAEILADAGPDVFLFVISVGNHGPWLADRGEEDALPLPRVLQDVPEHQALRRYLGGLRRTDAFFPTMTTALRNGPRPGLLLAYGDHQPSLPGLFKALGHRDNRTDYVLWDAGAVTHGAPPLESVSVESLPQRLLNSLEPVRGAEGVAA